MTATEDVTLVDVAHRLINRSLAQIRVSNHDDYQAVALLRVIYDMVDRRKGCETEQVTDGASLFQKRRVELQLRSGIPIGVIRRGWLRRLFGRRQSDLSAFAAGGTDQNTLPRLCGMT